jgi:hypothetical protein
VAASNSTLPGGLRIEREDGSSAARPVTRTALPGAPGSLTDSASAACPVSASARSSSSDQGSVAAAGGAPSGGVLGGLARSASKRA